MLDRSKIKGSLNTNMYSHFIMNNNLKQRKYLGQLEIPCTGYMSFIYSLAVLK